MAQWGAHLRMVFNGYYKENESQISSVTIKQEAKDEDPTVTTETHVIPKSKKRKHLTRSQCKEMEVVRAVQSNCHSSRYNKQKRTNNGSTIERWSAERYKLGEQRMFEAMKGLGANAANRVPRPELRKEARKYIGDTGLLDHLLKQIDGKVAPGGAERFRRCFNTNGVMEYWLESVDLDAIRQEAGVHDPYWTPPRRLMPSGDVSECYVSVAELKLLKAEMDKMKSDIQELRSKKQEEAQFNSMKMTCKELLTWRAKTEGRMNEITSCLHSMQGMLSSELIAWKSKVEQQLAEIFRSLGHTEALKPYKTSRLPAVEKWEDWWGGATPENIQDDELQSWLDCTDPDNAELEIAVKDLCSVPSIQLKSGDILTPSSANSREQDLLKNQTSKTNRDVVESVPKKETEDEMHVTPDSSGSAHSKSNLESPFHMFQELYNWKTEIEQRLTEISTSLIQMQTLQQKDQNFLLNFQGLQS